MNCRLAQKKINDSFAAGAGVLPPEVTAHRETCTACQDFFVAQQKLFRSLDAELESLVNAPASPSLLPRVRARLDEAQVASGSPHFGWRFLSLAAIVFLALSIPLFWQHPPRPSGAPAAVVFRAEEHPARETTSPPSAIVRRAGKRVAVLSSREETSAAPSLEVITLFEERAAFAKFVAEVPENRDVALALTRPASVPVDEPREIALLEIAALEVKPLEGAAAE